MTSEPKDLAVKGNRAKRSRSNSKRPSIIALTTEAFARAGYQSTSLRDIGEKAGMTAASFYYHFHNKEDLLSLIIVDGIDRLGALLMRELSNDATLEERFRRMLHAHILFTLENADATKVMVDEARFLSPEKFKPIREKQLAILNIYRTLIESLHKSGLIAPVDPTISAFLILSTINGFIRWFRPGRRVDLEVSVQSTIGYILQGIGLVAKPV